MKRGRTWIVGGAGLALLVSAAWWVRSREGEGVPAELRGQLRLFVLAGQSNMSGHGVLRPSDRAVTSRAYVFGNDYVWHEGHEPVDDATHQVDQISNDGLGPEHDSLGPGMAFARALLKTHPEWAVGLIPCALGGTSINQWQRAAGRDSLYGSCLHRAIEAKRMGVLAGLIFYQGESDAMDPTYFKEQDPSPQDWDQKFTQMIRDFRQDSGVSELPVVFAQIGQTTIGHYPNWGQVQSLQARVHLPGVAMIRTADLPTGDGVHLSSGSYDEAGRRFATAYLQLTGQGS